jgi:hypothetical protein
MPVALKQPYWSIPEDARRPQRKDGLGVKRQFPGWRTGHAAIGNGQFSETTAFCLPALGTQGVPTIRSRSRAFRRHTMP